LLRHSDFIYGLPTSTLPTISTESASLTPADRLRLVHTYITSTTSDGGLGIIPRSEEWDLVESVLGLHDHEFNEVWIRSWTTRQISSVKLEKIREQVCVFLH
jgi:anoctamin-10